MSTTPPDRKRRRLLMAGLGIVVGMTAGVVLLRDNRPPPSSSTPTSEPSVGGVLPRTVAPALAPRGQAFPNELARAVAAVGAHLDGRRTGLEGLTPEVTAMIDQARLLLGTVPRRSAPGLPMVLPDGTVAQIAPDPTPSDDAPGLATPPGTDATPADRERARAVDGRLIARTFTDTGKSPVPTRGDVVKEILEPDAWMAVPYDPALVDGQAFEITNRSLGEYVLRLDADDYGSVRLNGGLVVPGRHYLMSGTMIITGDIPVGVVIRPLGVVHGYYEQPVRPPSANG